MNCIGNANQKCGGNWRNSVFEIKSKSLRFFIRLKLFYISFIHLAINNASNCYSRYFTKVDKSIKQTSLTETVLIKKLNVGSLECFLLCSKELNCNMVILKFKECILLNNAPGVFNSNYQSYLKSSLIYIKNCFK